MARATRTTPSTRSTRSTRSTEPVIRLVGGPHKLDGASYDLSLSAHDRADADGTRFVRVFRGSSTMSLAALAEQCTDRETAEQLAREWRCAVFAYGHDRRLRTRYYRFQSSHPLEAKRDGHGRWTLEPMEGVVGPNGLAISSPRRELEPSSNSGAAAWIELERRLDEALGRFATVIDLLPDGPFRERADDERRAVGRAAADAARLCAVATTAEPLWPEDGSRDDQRSRVAGRIVTLIGAVDRATLDVVDLHLQTVTADVPGAPLAHLVSAITDLP